MPPSPRAEFPPLYANTPYVEKLLAKKRANRAAGNSPATFNNFAKVLPPQQLAKLVDVLKRPNGNSILKNMSRKLKLRKQWNAEIAEMEADNKYTIPSQGLGKIGAYGSAAARKTRRNRSRRNRNRNNRK